MSEPRNFEEEVATLQHRLNQLLGSFPRGMEQPEAMGKIEWTPALDVLENRDDIIIRIDIPGMKSDEINLSISGDVLQIKGERKQGSDREDENYHAIERGHGKFDRRVSLPTRVNMDDIHASYKDGVLTVKLPKLAEEKIGKTKVNLEQDE